jgi:hypothetical protein
MLQPAREGRAGAGEFLKRFSVCRASNRTVARVLTLGGQISFTSYPNMHAETEARGTLPASRKCGYAVRAGSPIYAVDVAMPSTFPA